MVLPSIIYSIATALAGKGGVPYVVGGAVRDYVMGRSSKDLDIEVFGISADDLRSTLSSFGELNEVGKSFGIYKLTVDGETYDFSLPRYETKTGEGYTCFAVNVDPYMSINEAAARRDFTINAIYYDILNCCIEDVFDGIADIEYRVIRHTSDCFSEDPLRVLRAFQFSSRFNFSVAEETVALCASISDTFSSLSTDRVWVEWEKWASRSENHEIGLRFLDACGWLRHFPLLFKLKEIPQSPLHHPEGNVWEHTCHSLGAISRLDTIPSDRSLLAFAVLTHDLGKITHTQFRECGKITSYGHELASGPLSVEFLSSIRASNYYIERVKPLVENHMFQISETSVKRMALKLHPATLQDLCAVMEADKRGRPPHPDVCPDVIHDILSLSSKLNVVSIRPSPIILGRHLLELGCKPGKQMGAVISQCFDAQLEGIFSDLEGGINHAKSLI